MIGTNNGWTGANPHNAAVMNNVRMNALLCPSSPLPPFHVTSGSSFGNINILTNHYEGIAGAVNQPPLFTELRQGACCFCCGSPCGTSGSAGVVSGGGMLIPNSALPIRNALDGTSNIAILGETSDWAWDYANPSQPVREHIEPGWLYGPTMGTATGTVFGTGWAGNWQRVFNLTSVMYQPGYNNYLSPGLCADHSSNAPFLSAHPAGSILGFTDGHVTFLPNDVDLVLLKRLCTRDDGGQATLTAGQ